MQPFAPIRNPSRPSERTTRPRPAGKAVSALFLGSCLLAAALSGCDKKADKGTVLAQVGNASLTLEELRESFPAEYEQLIRREQYLDFIKRWIDDEVLYQQALKGRLDDDPQVKRKLDKLLRKLLIEEFLARENASETFEPDETTMNQYYEMNKEEFRRKAPEVKIAHIRVQAPKLAADLRWKIQTDVNFLSHAATHSLDPVPESFASLAYKRQTELPACLAGDVAATRIGANTPPVACPDGVYIVRVIDRQEAGSLIPFPEAKEEISATLLMERKDKLLEGRVAKYKEGLAISYNLDQIPGLTEAPGPGPQEAPAPAAGRAAEPAPATPVPAKAGQEKIPGPGTSVFPRGTPAEPEAVADQAASRGAGFEAKYPASAPAAPVSPPPVTAPAEGTVGPRTQPAEAAAPPAPQEEKANVQ